MDKKYSTYFVDIDGTLLKYRKFDKLAIEQAEPIEEIVSFINRRYDGGDHVVIVTARPKQFRQFTIDELVRCGIKFHQLVMGVERGTRYIINDRDPEFPEENRAVGVNIYRNNEKISSDGSSKETPSKDN